jgi:hypothetical protein
MHCSDFLSVVKVSILERIFGNPLGAKLCDHLGNPFSKSNNREKGSDIRIKKENMIRVAFQIFSYSKSQRTIWYISYDKTA